MRTFPSSRTNGFTLIELLVVITILGILMSLGVAGAGAVRNQARTAQARNDCAGLANAIKSFYTDYSRYPIPSNKKDDSAFDAATSSAGNKAVLMPLMAQDSTVNPRGTTYYENKAAKLSGTLHTGGIFEGGLFDPWGYTFGICVDGDYDGTLKYSGSQLKFYSSTPGDVDESTWKVISGGVGVFSLGKDHCSESKSGGAPGILSWY